MFGMWNVWDVECSGCGMWDAGCLPECRMLIYKMPLKIRIKQQRKLNGLFFKEKITLNHLKTVKLFDLRLRL